jgi:hypothetical protein
MLREVRHGHADAVATPPGVVGHRVDARRSDLLVEVLVPLDPGFDQQELALRPKEDEDVGEYVFTVPDAARGGRRRAATWLWS